MAGEGLGLAYQASKPLEDKSYDIVSSQLAYIEQKKGAAEAAKREAELERQKAQAKFLESNKDLLQPKEGVGWLAHNQNEIIGQMQGIVFRAGELVGNGQVTEAYALTAAAKDSVEEIQRLSKLFAMNPEMAAKEVYGDDFEISTALNKPWLKIHEDFQKGNMAFQMKSDGTFGLYKMNENGETVEEDPTEISYIMSQPLKAAVDPKDWGLSIVKDMSKAYKTGTKNKNEVFQCWDCKVPDGYINLKQSSELLFKSDFSKLNPGDYLLTYAVNQYNMDPDEISKMSDEEFIELRDEFIEATARPAATEKYELNHDKNADALEKASLANTYNAIKNRDAGTQIKRKNANTSARRADEYIRRGKDEDDSDLVAFDVEVPPIGNGPGVTARAYNLNNEDWKITVTPTGEVFSNGEWEKANNVKPIPLNTFVMANDGRWMAKSDEDGKFYIINQDELKAAVGQTGRTLEQYMIEAEANSNQAQPNSGGVDTSQFNNL